MYGNWCWIGGIEIGLRNCGGWGVVCGVKWDGGYGYMVGIYRRYV